MCCKGVLSKAYARQLLHKAKCPVGGVHKTGHYKRSAAQIGRWEKCSSHCVRVHLWEALPPARAGSDGRHGDALLLQPGEVELPWRPLGAHNALVLHMPQICRHLLLRPPAPPPPKPGTFQAPAEMYG